MAEYGTSEVAELLGISTRQLQRRRARAGIEPRKLTVGAKLKLNRYTEEDLDRLKKAKRPAGRPKGKDRT